MRTIKIVLLVVMLVGIGGCGVIMDAAHTTALNQSAAYADRMADLADSNQLTMDQAEIAEFLGLSTLTLTSSDTS